MSVELDKICRLNRGMAQPTVCVKTTTVPPPHGAMPPGLPAMPSYMKTDISGMPRGLYIATHALQGILSRDEKDPKTAAKLAIECACALVDAYAQNEEQRRQAETEAQVSPPNEPPTEPPVKLIETVSNWLKEKETDTDSVLNIIKKGIELAEKIDSQGRSGNKDTDFTPQLEAIDAHINSKLTEPVLLTMEYDEIKIPKYLQSSSESAKRFSRRER